MKKVAFYGIAETTRHICSGEIPRVEGISRRAGSDIENIMELYDITDNKGNMIHGEAPQRLIELDREKSCIISVKDLLSKENWSKEKLVDTLNDEFDLIVLSFANVIRKDFDPSGIKCYILENIKIDFIVVGMGMQCQIPAILVDLHPNLVRLLDICNKKAKLFWVRGLETESWLHSVGYKNAKALGCPSLYLYPNNILNLYFSGLKETSKAVTAGYISSNILRASTIISVFKDFNAHYVMQDEIPALFSQGFLNELPSNFYNDATGEINKHFIDSILNEVHFEKMPFSSYRWFHTPDAWRSFVSSFDFYLGDRLHGGVVALQCGIPTIMIAEDIRVKEVADYFGVPRAECKDIDLMSLEDILHTYLSHNNIEHLKSTYHERFIDFQNTFKELEIPLTINLAKTNPPPFSTLKAPSKNKPKSINIKRAIRSFIRKI